METLTAKQVAQTFYLDDIVMHDVILEAYAELEKQLTQYSIPWNRADIIFKLGNLSMDHSLTGVFNLKKQKIMETIKESYNAEIEHLYMIGKP